MSRKIRFKKEESSENFYDRKHLSQEISWAQDERIMNRLGHVPTTKKEQATLTNIAGKSDHARVVMLWLKQCRAYFPNKRAAIDSSDARMISSLVHQFKYEELERMILWFFKEWDTNIRINWFRYQAGHPTITMIFKYRSDIAKESLLTQP